MLASTLLFEPSSRSPQSFDLRQPHFGASLLSGACEGITEDRRNDSPPLLVLHCTEVLRPRRAKGRLRTTQQASASVGPDPSSPPESICLAFCSGQCELSHGFTPHQQSTDLQCGTHYCSPSTFCTVANSWVGSFLARPFNFVTCLFADSLRQLLCPLPLVPRAPQRIFFNPYPFLLLRQGLWVA